MFLVILIIVSVISICVTKLWVKGSHYYIEISRSYAASSFPGDLTKESKLFYQLGFSVSLFIILVIVTFIIYLIFKNRVEFSLFKKILIIFIVPIICTIFIFVNLYLFMFRSGW